jgi:hypothetical protein
MPETDMAEAAQRAAVISPTVEGRQGEREHPRVLGWLGTSALAMGGSNQSLFVVGALIATQGTGAVPLLVIGLLLSWRLRRVGPS